MTDDVNKMIREELQKAIPVAMEVARQRGYDYGLIDGAKAEREAMLSNLEKLYSELEFDGPFQDDLFRREIIEELRDWLKGREEK